MPYCPDIILRAPFMDRLGAASRHREQFNVAAVLADLRGPMSLVDIAQKHGLIGEEHAEEARHLRRDWYNEEEEDGWWPQHPVEDIVREAYAIAIGLADELDKPLDAYWMPARPGGEDRFRASLTTSADQITLLFHTPPVPRPAPPPDELVDDEAVCVIEVDESGAVSRRCGRRLR